MKRLVVKEWFQKKIEEEKGKELRSTRVFAVMKESEKAMYVMVCDAYNTLSFWCPKSCIEEEETEFEGTLFAIGEDYGKVLNECRLYQRSFR